MRKAVIFVISMVCSAQVFAGTSSGRIDLPVRAGTLQRGWYTGPSNIREACGGDIPCAFLDDGAQRGLCEAYKEGRRCFMALGDGADRGWCEVIKEGASCFIGLEGAARDRCEEGRYPRDHWFWAACGGVTMPEPENQFLPLVQACRGDTPCAFLDDKTQRGLCEAYKEGQSCFMALGNGPARAWCEVIKEGSDCFTSLEGAARDRCEEGRHPQDHRFWARCGGVEMP